MLSEYLPLTAAFFTIALLYASVGFGGGSSYLAIMAIFLPGSVGLIKTTGLLCNLVVAGGGSYLYLRRGELDWKKSRLVIAAGIAAAFLGGTVQLQDRTFFLVLGTVLSLSGLLLLLPPARRQEPLRSGRTFSPMADAALGAGTGFLAGLVSIGGGILLSPLLNLLRWDGARKIAALASVFIFLNSLAVLAGQAATGRFVFEPGLSLLLLAAVFTGGQLGTRLSLRYIRPRAVRALTGVLVCYIGIKLVLKHSKGIDI